MECHLQNYSAWKNHLSGFVSCSRLIGSGLWSLEFGSSDNKLIKALKNEAVS
jgi:hypothetical protein